MAREKQAEKELTPEEKLQQALVPAEEQPYGVPENWCWVRLNAIVDLYNGDRGENYPSKKDYQISGIPFINAGALNNGQLDENEFNFITEEKYNSLRSGKIMRGDILYCLRGSLGKSAIVDTERMGAISSSLCIIRPKSGVSEKYLFYLMNSDVIRRQQNFAENGSAQPNLSAASVMQYMVPFPSEAEQSRIVSRIESLFAKLDEAKEKGQAVVDGFELRKSAILYRAFTGELTAQWRKKRGIEQTNWGKKRIGNFAEVRGGKRLPKGHKLITKETDHPYLRIADFKDNSIETSDLCYITDETFAQIDRYIIKKEDVYLSIVGSIGKAGTIPDELDGANLTENAARIISKKTIPHFLSLFLSSPIAQDDIKERIRSATLGKLSLNNIKNILVPLPSLEEQAKIVAIANSLLAKEQHAKEVAEAVLAQIDTMKKAILAHAFRGELGTNDLTEKNAERLLQEVLKTEKSNTTSRTKTVFIPKELETQLDSELERKIIKLFLKNDSATLPIEKIMAASSKKFDVIEALRNLEQKEIVKKLNNGNYDFMR